MWPIVGTGAECRLYFFEPSPRDGRLTFRKRAIGWTAGGSPRVVRYGWAVVVALAAIGLTTALAPWLDAPFYLVCVGAVAISAAFGGTGPGLLTAVLAGGCATPSLPRLPAFQQVAWFGAYSVVSAVVAFATGWSRAAFFAVMARRRDITRAVRGRLEFLRAITRAMDEGVYALDPTGHLTYLNAAAERMLGYRQSEVLGLPLKEALRCRRIDGACSGKKCRLLHVIASGEPLRGADDLLTRKDGTCFPVRYSSAPLVRGGQTVGAVVVFQDVTEERRQQERDRFLAKATEELAHSIDYEETLARVARLALPFLGDWSMVVLVDERGSPRRIAVEALDPAHAVLAREMLHGYPIDLEADHGAGRVLRTGEPELLTEVADIVGHSGPTTRTRAQLLHRLGLRSFMAVPLRARGRVFGVVDFGITDSGRRFDAADVALATELAGRCAMAIDNARLHRQAHDAVRAREHMLAVVSHELRNPLGAISMAASIVERGLDSAARAEHARASSVIERACGRMNRLIGDLGDLASIDGGRLSLKRAELAADRIVEDAVEAVRAAAQDAEIDLSSVPAAEPLFVLADHDRLQQVLVNLLSNAIRVTPPGGRVWVRHRRRGEAVVFSVSDTGPGIAREQQARIFEAYWRGSDVRYKGSGLGLSIANGILAAHGGRLWVVSRPGRGATFRFSLPSLAVEGAQPGGVAAPQLSAGQQAIRSVNVAPPPRVPPATTSGHPARAVRR